MYWTSLRSCDCFQMVDRLDDEAIAAQLGPLDYKGLYKVTCSRKFYHSGILVFIIHVSFLNLEMVSGSWKGTL